MSRNISKTRDMPEKRDWQKFSSTFCSDDAEKSLAEDPALESPFSNSLKQLMSFKPKLSSTTFGCSWAEGVLL